MLIDGVPELIGGRASLNDRLVAEALERGLTIEQTLELIALVPEPLISAQCFLDRLTHIWRYEFGRAYDEFLYGPHVWTPVTTLVRVLRSVPRHLEGTQRCKYVGRLGHAPNHFDALMEFLPIVRLPAGVVAEHEVLTGAGKTAQRDVDWRLTKPGLVPVLIDVKNRRHDLLHLTARVGSGEQRPNGHAPQPTHDTALVFEGIAKKYLAQDPDVQLQGAWVKTGLKQEASELQASFDALDRRKVHFVIIGGWEPGVLVLTRRPQDRAVVLDMCGEQLAEDRWQFVREKATEG